MRFLNRPEAKIRGVATHHANDMLARLYLFQLLLDADGRESLRRTIAFARSFTSLCWA